MEKRYLTVSALNRYLKAKIDADTQLQKILIKGEISNFKHHTSGHLYFTLKDEKSRINAVMFSSKANKMLFELENGMKVLIQASVSVYDVAGTYQLYVDSIEQDGLGNLFLRYEQLKKQLSLEGLFDLDKKITIPKFPSKIAVLSAYPSAALADIVRTINLRFPVVRVIVFPIPVQGKDAYIHIIRTLNYVDTLKFSTIIIARGGGSLEDLWNFNEEGLARAICNCKTPIISGVGHEVDFTICDFVADYRAATPTAAAIKATPDLIELKQSVNNLQYKLNTLMKQKITLNEQLLRRIKSFYLFKNPDKLFEDKKAKVDYLYDRLNDIFTYNLSNQCNKAKHLMQIFNHQANLFTINQNNHLNLINKSMEQLMKQKMKYEQERFYYLVSKLNTLSPLTTLERGYAIILKDEKVISKADDLKSGDKVEIKMKGGSQKAIIE
ncbi:exodeoxyribonuclease VII large subunit [Thomasclavelia cocleata]|uniref:Exodeoxyribonuclease 7 large subunit n=1 Tax=Thomasclavelia cocleata TaxID=69824 RepID=A0A1I0BCI0_9FIRM|nr:exodeoxyribonuclease VII large subunit [Thomasclavelia cocleata]MCR1959935.1 exodeoxyribonuclease VII large subunit [Thomasclavelia cocleata]NDO41722.1 exodeoxyribonuclease VII large subunit [Thomasclavelia cocleata]PJN79753.1 exodeoxyribonuclease VII large subunit [Thomasclavelia cocleata]SET04475.1 Exodeoxyribonuclease VII large subunit [Thomasclavelia cocleata]